MGQLRSRAENLKPAEFNLPSDQVGTDPIRLWPVSQGTVVSLLQSFADNSSIRAAVKKDKSLVRDEFKLISLLLKEMRDAIERTLVQSLREEDEKAAIEDLRALPFGDFNAMLATLFAITFPGGVEGFLSLWRRVTGLPLTSLAQDDDRSDADLPSETSTDSSSSIQTKPELTDEELGIS